MVFRFKNPRIVVIVSVADFWVYPFLKVMPPPVISVFFVACFFAVLGIYFLGQLVGHWRWRGQCVVSPPPPPPPPRDMAHLCFYYKFILLSKSMVYVHFYILSPCIYRTSSFD